MVTPNNTTAFLAHHGIKGQKWGVRRFQNPDGSLTSEGKKRYSSSTPPNTELLKDYNGPAYFISSNDSLKNLNPRVPDNFFTKNGYEDSSTPRVSFAPSIDKCLAGLSQNVDGKKFTVYKPKDVRNHKFFKPNKKAVPDSAITDELWICEPVELEKVGDLKVTGNKGGSGKNFSYGNHEATLYDDWTYEMNNLNHNDTDNFLAHHGILGQKWGVRRYQNEDGSLTDVGRKHYQKLDTKWAKKNTDKITKQTQKKVRKDLEAYNKELAKSPNYLNANGQVSKATINAYNRKMASLMNTAVGDIESPSGRVVRFVAKRGEVGVQMALADRGYDMNQLKNGVWTGGRVAYRSNQLNKIDI